MKPSYIQPTAGYFDEERLVEASDQISRMYPNLDQINLRRPASITDAYGVTYGAGSLYTPELQRQGASEHIWTEYIDTFKDSYLIDVCKQMANTMSNVFNIEIGRARILHLPGKTNLTLHTDHGVQYRFHVPIVTNPGVFFVTNDEVERMPEPGRLYVYRTDVPHTVVNASRTRRTHLVISGWKK